MASETLCIRAYLCLLLAAVATATVLVLMAAQNSIATSAVSQEGVSVQLAVSRFCSNQYALVQTNINQGLGVAVDADQVANVR